MFIVPSLFDDRNISAIRFFEYIKWVAASFGAQCDDPLGLPPVQRTALWTPKHVLGLWDSLLRGMPIGMFYLIRNTGVRREFYDSGGGTGPTREDRVGGYDLLDGQQRTRAMMLALRSSKDEGRCVWIDLGAKPDEGALLTLRLTTRSQPFGYNAEGGKLSLPERRAARESFDGQNGGADERRLAGRTGTETRRANDHELFDLEIEQTGRKRPPTPAKASFAAVPLTELIALWNEAGNDTERFKLSVRDLVSPPADAALHLEALSTAFSYLHSLEIALVLVERPQFENSATDADWLLRLFERIGAGGIPLTNAERLYSIYKFHEPYVHDTVTAIENDKAVGHVMPATEIAGTAMRIAASQKRTNPSFGVPDVVTFAENMAEYGSEFEVELHKLVPQSTEFARYDGNLKAAFGVLFDCISYDEARNPSGIPKVMLVELPSEVIQVMVYWVVLAKAAGVDLCEAHRHADPVRGEMIRFALFWQLCSFNNDKGARQAFRFLRNHEICAEATGQNGFPGRNLYHLLTGDKGRDRCAYSLVPPDLIRAYGMRDPTPYWRSSKARFERDDNKKPSEMPIETKDLYRTWWWSRGKILLWLQRKYLTNEFADYDPSSDRDDEKPYDLDHIQPQAEWGFHMAAYATNLDQTIIKDNTLYACFVDGRNQLGNGIGNFRWIGSSENKAAGANDLVQKLELNQFIEAGGQVEREHPWMASAFDIAPAAITLWITGGGNGIWTPARMQAFQRAVEDRAAWLFHRFWTEAGFAAWLHPEDAASRTP